MTRLLLGLFTLCLLFGAGCSTCPKCCPCYSNEGEAPMLAHNVFFTLAEKSPETRDKLIQACHTYLKDHPGVVYFAAGARCEELTREVNDTEYDVGLIVVFDTTESHDTYQTAPDHLKFIEECKDLWSSVRVFDTLLE